MSKIFILIFLISISTNKLFSQYEWKKWLSVDKKIQISYPVDLSPEETDFQHLLLLKFPLEQKNSKFGEYISLSRKTVGRFAKFEDCYNWYMMEIEEDGWKIMKKELVKQDSLNVFEIIYTKKLAVEMIKKEFLVLKNSELLNFCFTSEKDDFESNILLVNQIFSKLKFK
jgi:hypothetical protein